MAAKKIVGVCLLGLLCVQACGDDGGNATGDGGGSGSDANGRGDGGACTAPDMLILLDRTGTMHRDLSGATPPDTAAGHATSKLTLAINALDALVTTANLDQTLRLGLSMFPMDPGTGCLTLTQRLQGQPFGNPACQAGEIEVSPALGTGAAIAAAIDPETTTICNTTPVGAGLQTSKTELDAKKVAGVDQYIVLVTDGADFADSCPTPDPIQLLKDFDAAGVKTYIVGFGAQNTTPSGVNPPVLNQLACAGHTAKNFATACRAATGGGFEAVDPNGANLYFDAGDAAALTTSLREVASTVCCGCVL